jgi:hypothetical protein
MIVVRVELWPHGDPRPLRQIALLGIVNVGRDGDGRHTYEARFEGRITRLSHDRADGALALVARAIAALAEGSEPDTRAQLGQEDEHLPGIAHRPGSSAGRSRQKTDSPSGSPPRGQTKAAARPIKRVI